MTLAERHTAVGMLTAGMTGCEVAAHFGRSESTISHLWTKYRLTGTVIDRPRSGRPRKTLARAAHFGRSESTISHLWTKYRLTGTVIDRPRSGRPRKTLAREDRYIIITSRRNRFMTSGTMATRLRVTTGVRITDQTVRNWLRAARLRGCRPYMGVLLTLRHGIDKVNWVRAHQRWTHDH